MRYTKQQLALVVELPYDINKVGIKRNSLKD